MGKHFGNLQKLKGVYYYTLSPMEINPTTMMFEGFKNAVRKTVSALTFSAVPISTGILTYYWGTTTHQKLQRKNPDDYKDDV